MEAPIAPRGTLYRDVTPVATVGQMGQLFTIYEKNWHCKDCRQENYANRARCFRCKKKRPEGEHDYVQDAALQAAQTGATSSWQEVIDPDSHQIYYYHRESGVTQWERPEEMGAAPMATGWFGRGKAGSSAAQQYADRNTRLLSRPARKQKDFIDPKKYHLEGAQEYNIWYDKYFGDTRDSAALREPAADRCIIDRDGGFTKADGGGSQRKERRSFCVHFARGMCAKGADCPFYHRTPTPEDDARCDELFDCFGRQRHSSHRDDMNGVGSFMKPSRTLFVGNLQRQKYSSPKELEDAVWKHFAEWGELENCNVIHRLSIAFPRYRFRTSAEFAKEAMTCQALDHNEVLSIRWARDDPNPMAQEAIVKADKDALAALLQARGISIEKAPFHYPSDYQIPAAKRIKLSDGTDVTASLTAVSYPDTDCQYPDGSWGSSSQPATAGAGGEEGAYTYEQYVSDTIAAGGRPMSADDYMNYYSTYYATYCTDQYSSQESTQHVNSVEAVNQGGLSTSTGAPPALLTTAADSFASQKASLLQSLAGLDGYSTNNSLPPQHQQQQLMMAPSPSSFTVAVPTTSNSATIAAAAAVVAAAAAKAASTSSASDITSASGAVSEDQSSITANSAMNTYDVVCTKENNEEDDDNEEEEEEEPEDKWTEYTDPETGAIYYYNAAKGISSWGAPPSDTSEEGEEEKLEERENHTA